MLPLLWPIIVDIMDPTIDLDLVLCIGPNWESITETILSMQIFNLKVIDLNLRLKAY